MEVLETLEHLPHPRCWIHALVLDPCTRAYLFFDCMWACNKVDVQGPALLLSQVETLSLPAMKLVDSLWHVRHDICLRTCLS